MTAQDRDLDRIGALLKDAIGADLAKGADRSRAVRTRLQRANPALKWSAALGGAGVVAAVVTALVAGGGGQPSFAGWSAHPTRPAAGQLMSADTGCEGVIGAVPPSVSQGADVGSLVPEVSDVRGPYTVTLFGDGSTSGALCVSDPGGNATVQWITWPGAPVGSGVIALDQVKLLADGGQPFTLVEGRTGSAVTGVALGLEDGSQVTATVGNGFFLAWWPGRLSAGTAVVATASGSSTENLAPGSPPGGSNQVCDLQGCTSS